MRVVQLLLVGIVWGMLSVVTGEAQTLPEFNLDAVSVRGKSAERSRLDIYTRIAYADLSFIQQGNKYLATYEVQADIYALNEDERPEVLVLSKSWERQVAVPRFELTRQDTLFDYTTESVELLPGKYALQVYLEDLQSGQRFSREQIVTVRDFNKPIALSDLLIIRAYDVRQQAITPEVGSVVGTDQAQFSLFYEIYAEQGQFVRVSYEVFREREARSRSFLQTILGIKRKVEIPGAEISYSAVDLLPVMKGRNPATITIPLKQFKPGQYRVRVLLEDPEGRLLDVAERTFTTRWAGIEEQLKNLDQAIAQLIYIAKDKEIKFIREAKTYQEKLRRFRAFWKKRDPTPGTRRNERMEEYYYRIAYANRRYGYFTDGWLTDRGEVFIRFGEPDAIERHPYNFDAKPYEIWYYNSLGRQFIFVDKTGFGDYELLVPIWDERTRMR